MCHYSSFTSPVLDPPAVCRNTRRESPSLGITPGVTLRVTGWRRSRNHTRSACCKPTLGAATWRHDRKSGQHRGDYRRHPGSTAAAPVGDVGVYAQIRPRVDVVIAQSTASFIFMPSRRLVTAWTSHAVHIWTHTVWYRRRALYKLATPPDCHSAGLLQDTSRLYQRKWHVFTLSS